MKISAELLSSLIQDIYAAAAEPSLWPVFMRRLEAITDSSRSYMLSINKDRHASFAVENGFDPALAALYAQFYRDCDPLVFAYEDARAKAGGTWVGSTSSVIADAAFYASAGFNDIMAPQGDIHLCGALTGVEDGTVSVAMRRAKGQPPFGPDVVDLLTLLTPHMRQAVLLQCKLGELTNRAAVFEGSADAFGVAVVSLDSEGKVRSISSRAQMLLAGKDGIRLHNGRLSAERTADDARLQSLFVSAAGIGRAGQHHETIGLGRSSAPEGTRMSESTLAAGGCMRIMRGATRPPLYVSVFPARMELSSFAASSVSVLVFLGDGMVPVAGRTEVLRELCGTTPTEGRIASLLLQGWQVKQMQDTLQLSTDAIRFHLKTLFHKTGTSRQSDLIKLLLTLPAVVC